MSETPLFVAVGQKMQKKCKKLHRTMARNLTFKKVSNQPMAQKNDRKFSKKTCFPIYHFLIDVVSQNVRFPVEHFQVKSDNFAHFCKKYVKNSKKIKPRLGRSLRKRMSETRGKKCVHTRENLCARSRSTPKKCDIFVVKKCKIGVFFIKKICCNALNNEISKNRPPYALFVHKKNYFLHRGCLRDTKKCTFFVIFYEKKFIVVSRYAI